LRKAAGGIRTAGTVCCLFGKEKEERSEIGQMHRSFVRFFSVLMSPAIENFAEMW
jgi:hypothetical protein